MSTEKMKAMYDVVAVSVESNAVRLMATNKDRKNAEAIVNMAVMRRGVDEEFFAEVPAGLYAEGDQWEGHR
jgi:hypothetical protein